MKLDFRQEPPVVVDTFPRKGHVERFVASKNGDAFILGSPELDRVFRIHLADGGFQTAGFGEYTSCLATDKNGDFLVLRSTDGNNPRWQRWEKTEDKYTSEYLSETSDELSVNSELCDKPGTVGNEKIYIYFSLRRRRYKNRQFRFFDGSVVVASECLERRRSESNRRIADLQSGPLATWVRRHIEEPYLNHD